MYIYTYKQNRKITSHLITKIHVSRKKVSKFLVLYTYVPPISLSFRIDIVIVPNYFASPLYSWSTRIKPPLNSGKTFTFVIVLEFRILKIPADTLVLGTYSIVAHLCSYMKSTSTAECLIFLSKGDPIFENLSLCSNLSFDPFVG